MPYLFLVTAPNQLPPEGRAAVLWTILIVIVIAFAALGLIVAIRGFLLPRSQEKKSAKSQPTTRDASAWKLSADRVEPFPSPGANDETRGLGDDHTALEDDEDDD